MPSPWRMKGAFTFLVSALLLSGSAFGQQERVVLTDAKVVVTEVDVTSFKPYTLSAGPNGVVWMAVDPVTMFNRGGRLSREVQAGEGEFERHNEILQFHLTKGERARLIVVCLKAPLHQPLTVEPFVFDGHDIEDASARNETLLVAIDDCHFRDTRDLGDESQWIPDKPEAVAMKTGQVRWIRPGIHHFKDLNSTPARLVSIEW